MSQGTDPERTGVRDKLELSQKGFTRHQPAQGMYKHHAVTGRLFSPIKREGSTGTQLCASLLLPSFPHSPPLWSCSTLVLDLAMEVGYIRKSKASLHYIVMLCLKKTQSKTRAVGLICSNTGFAACQYWIAFLLEHKSSRKRIAQSQQPRTAAIVNHTVHLLHSRCLTVHSLCLPLLGSRVLPVRRCC